jgi:hypothetical protein
MRNGFGHGSLLEKDCQAGWRMRRRVFVMWVALRETAATKASKQRQDHGAWRGCSVMLVTQPGRIDQRPDAGGFPRCRLRSSGDVTGRARHGSTQSSKA